MEPDQIARDFKLYCEHHRPEVLLLLPKRLRNMEPAIQRIIEERHAKGKAAAQGRARPPNNQ